MKTTLLFGLLALAGILGVSYAFPPSHVLNKAATSETTLLAPISANVNLRSVTPDEYMVSAKEVKNLSVDSSNTIVIVGEIGEGMFAVAQELQQKAKAGKPLYLIINSPGGSVLDGVQVISTMQSLKVPVYTVCAGLCASMAAMIHSYGTKRYMVDRSILMYHEASGGVQGQFNQIKSRFRVFDRLISKMDYEVAIRAGKNPEEFRKALASEIWLDAEDAVQQGYADKIVSVDMTSLFGPLGISNRSQTSALDAKFKVRLSY